MSKNTAAAKSSKSSTAAKAAPKAPTTKAITPPALPVVANATKKLTREEWRALSPEQKRARKEAKRASTSGAGKLLSSLSRMEKMGRNISAALSGDEAAQATARKVLGQLGELRETLEALPEDWQPARKASSAGTREARFKVGDRVAIAEKRRSAYEGLIDDMENLVVVTLAQKRAVLDAGGVRIVLPLNMIVPAKATDGE